MNITNARDDVTASRGGVFPGFTDGPRGTPQTSRPPPSPAARRAPQCRDRRRGRSGRAGVREWIADRGRTPSRTDQSSRFTRCALTCGRTGGRCRRGTSKTDDALSRVVHAHTNERVGERPRPHRNQELSHPVDDVSILEPVGRGDQISLHGKAEEQGGQRRVRGPTRWRRK